MTPIELLNNSLKELVGKKIKIYVWKYSGWMGNENLVIISCDEPKNKSLILETIDKEIKQASLMYDEEYDFINYIQFFFKEPFNYENVHPEFSNHDVVIPLSANLSLI